MLKKDFLLEIGTEELPPKSLQILATALYQNIVDGITEKGLSFSDSKLSAEKNKIFAAPRRLGVLLEGLAVQQPEQRLERRGPAVKAAYDAQGQPTAAALGFAKSCGVAITMLQTQKTDKGEWLHYSATLPGKPTIELLNEIVNAAVKKLPIAKPMRWGRQQIEFIRPVHWVLMLFGKAVVPGEVLGKIAAQSTYGHRFHYPQAINIKQPQDYELMLEKKASVIADFEKRKQLIEENIKQLATASGGVARYPKALLDEVTAIVEYPVVLRACFDQQFLQVPQEALIAAMQGHQKSFAVFDDQGALLPYFIFVANVKSKCPQQVIAGNEKVMRARLSDAAFFYQSDLKTSLSKFLPRLKNVIFQQQLGDLAARSKRLEQLSTFIAEQLNADVQAAARAGLLCKCDLVTDMVYEFPELQGIMGAYYAQHADEAAVTSMAIKQHYQPEFSGDQLPNTTIAQCVALADKLDLLVGIFGIAKHPSGDKDPFGLRRAAIGVVRILLEKQLNIDLSVLVRKTIEQYGDKIDRESTYQWVTDYILARLHDLYRRQGVTTPVFLAVQQKNQPIAATTLCLDDFDQRIKAVQRFKKLPAIENLVAANKRVSNILRKHATVNFNDRLDQDLLQVPAEKNLYALIKNKQAVIEPLLAAKDYPAILNTLVDLQQPLDDFFAQVMVMTEDQVLRKNRLLLLNDLHLLFLTVADIAQLS